MVFVEQFKTCLGHLSAPLYYHFGQYNWFVDTAVSVNELVDVNVLYFLFFLILNLIVLYKNTAFKSFVKSIFKMPLSHTLHIIYMFYYNFFFTNFSKIFYYFQKFFTIFKKK